MQMNYNLSKLNFPNTLLDDLHGLQRDDVLCDLQLICDNGDVWIHRAVLEVWNLWWCCLLRDSTTNVILLPAVSMLEVEKFVGKIYGEFNFSPNDDENDTFHGFTEAEIDIAAGKSFKYTFTRM